MALHRLDPDQLRALARSVRDRAHGPDRVSDSVAAALESVSHRRALQARHRRVGTAMIQITDLGWAALWMLGRARLVVARRLRDALGPGWYRPEQPQRRSGDGVRSARAATAPDTATATVEAALQAVERGEGIAPAICDKLVDSGWAEWVDRADGTAIDMNHPRSLLQLTATGKTCHDRTRGDPTSADAGQASTAAHGAARGD